MEELITNNRPNQRAHETSPPEPEATGCFKKTLHKLTIRHPFCCSKKCFLISLGIITLVVVLSLGGYFVSSKLKEEKNKLIPPKFQPEGNMVSSACGFSMMQNNKKGQVTYERYFTETGDLETTKGAVTVKAEGIYLVNFYSHIDSGYQDKNSSYSAYLRLNGKNLKSEGHVKSSLVGRTPNQDVVTTGRNLVLHLHEGYKVDVGLENVMPNGKGLTHSSFCVAEITRSKNSVSVCGVKDKHGLKKDVVTYDRHLQYSNGFGKETLNLGSGSFEALVDGVYLVNFDSIFDTGRGRTKTTANEYRVVLRKNGERIGAEGSIITSVRGSNDNHDYVVTTGRSISLHLKKEDKIDVFVEDVINIGAGLTSSSFCVTLIHNTPSAAMCGFMQGPVNSKGVLTYDRMFTDVNEFNDGVNEFHGLNPVTGVFKALTNGIYLVNFDTQIDSGPGPRDKDVEYYSAFIRKNEKNLAFEGHVKSSVVGTDKFHVNVLTGRSLVLQLKASDEIDINVDNIMAKGGGLYSATFCVTLLRGDALEN